MQVSAGSARKGKANELAGRGCGYGMQAAQRQRFRNQTRTPGTRHLAPRSEAPNPIKIRKQGAVVPGYDTVDGAGMGAFAGMPPADQCAQRAMGAFKVTRAPSRSRRDSRCHQRVAPLCWLERPGEKKAWLFSYGNSAF